MSLSDLVQMSRSKKLMVIRRQHEIGLDDVPIPCLFVAASGSKKLAWATPSGGAGPYVARGFHIAEALHTGDSVVAVASQSFPPTTFVFRPADGDEVPAWDQADEDLDEFDAQIESEVTARATQLVRPPEPQLRSFDFVRWRALTPDGWADAGVLFARPDRSGVDVGAFDGFEDDALAWSDRFEQVGTGILNELPTYAGRDQDIGPPENVLAVDYENALDRAKYAVAKDHFAETGRSLY